jgi:hypothetical protein
MNGKQLACVILMAMIGVMTYAGQIVHKKTLAMRQDSEAAEAAAADADMRRNVAEVTTQRTRQESSEKHRFLQTWTPFIDRMQTQQEVEGAIMASLRASSVYTSSQKFEQKNNRDLVLPSSIRASLIIEDEYAKTMNWLGDLERRLPLTRLTMCRVTGAQEDKNIRMELALEVPLVNLNADPLGTAVAP